MACGNKITGSNLLCPVIEKFPDFRSSFCITFGEGISLLGSFFSVNFLME